MNRGELFAPAGLSVEREARAAKIKRVRNAQFEDEFASQCDALKLPPFERQYPFAAPLGRKFKADFAWPDFKLLVEIQGAIFMRGGGGHSHPTGILRDMEKQQHAVLLGYFLLPVTTDSVKPRTAIALVQRVLAMRGWQR